MSSSTCAMWVCVKLCAMICSIRVMLMRRDLPNFDKVASKLPLSSLCLAPRLKAVFKGEESSFTKWLGQWKPRIPAEPSQLSWHRCYLPAPIGLQCLAAAGAKSSQKQAWGNIFLDCQAEIELFLMHHKTVTICLEIVVGISSTRKPACLIVI